MKKLVLTNGSVPPGSYVAKFLGFVETEANQFGPGLRWEFEILSGTYAGVKIGRTTGQTPTTKNQCGKMLVGISGKSNLGEEIDLSTFVGQKYLIVVVARPEGGTTIDSVSSPPVC